MGTGIMEHLKKRRDYLAAARGAKAVRKAFILQSRRRDDGGEDTGPARNAVDRNRIRRRLKAAALLTAPAAGRDIVLIGRRAALSVPFGDLVADLETAILETSGDARSGGRVMDNVEGAHERGGPSGARSAARRQT
jgi:ribonuclease P protein component